MIQSSPRHATSAARQAVVAQGSQAGGAVSILQWSRGIVDIGPSRGFGKARAARRAPKKIRRRRARRAISSQGRLLDTRTKACSAPRAEPEAQGDPRMGAGSENGCCRCRWRGRRGAARTRRAGDSRCSSKKPVLRRRQAARGRGRASTARVGHRPWPTQPAPGQQASGVWAPTGPTDAWPGDQYAR